MDNTLEERMVMTEGLEAIIDYLNRLLREAQNFVAQETQIREKMERIYIHPHFSLQEALVEVESLGFSNQRLRDSREAIKNQWSSKVKQMESLSQRDRADTYHAYLEDGK